RVLLRDAPVVDAARRPLPILRAADFVVVADLRDLRGVLDHATPGSDEVAEHVVARAVTTRSPDRFKAGVAHAADASHHRLERRQLEGDMIERGGVRACIGDAMVLAVAA